MNDELVLSLPQHVRRRIFDLLGDDRTKFVLHFLLADKARTIIGAYDLLAKTKGVAQLSRGGAFNTFKSLEAAGVIEVTGQVASGERGRASRTYQVTPMGAACLDYYLRATAFLRQVP